jgi:hypothetical protein
MRQRRKEKQQKTADNAKTPSAQEIYESLQQEHARRELKARRARRLPLSTLLWLGLKNYAPKWRRQPR